MIASQGSPFQGLTTLFKKEMLPSHMSSLNLPGTALSHFQEYCPWIPERRAQHFPLHIPFSGNCREQQCHPPASKGDKTRALNCSSRACHPALHQLGFPPLDTFEDLCIHFKLWGPIYGIAFLFCGGTQNRNAVITAIINCFRLCYANIHLQCAALCREERMVSKCTGYQLVFRCNSKHKF